MKHVICLSGGKDSTAMALALKEKEPREYIYIYTPTGDELPTMDQHWHNLKRLLKSHIYSVNPGLSFTELIYEQNMIPNFRARFCTRILKIEPTQEFINKLGNACLYVGLRADEDRKGGVYEVEQQRFPLQEWDWNIKDVWSYLESKNIIIPARTDCAMCFYQRIGEWWDLWKLYPDLYQHAVNIENNIGHTFRTPGKDKWPSALKDLREVFKTGKVPRNARIQTTFLEDNYRCRACTL